MVTEPVSPWRNRIIDHGQASPNQLLANPRNWRIHPKAQQDALTEMLDNVGWVQDVIVNRRTGYVVDGHLRVAMAISRQESSVPVVYVDLSEGEEGLVLAALDPLAAMAVTDEKQLTELLAGMTVEGSLADMLSALVAKTEPKAGLTDPDDVPEVAEPTTNPGDLWILGDHRLLCGDSTNAQDVARLMNGETARLMATDPPYLVDYDGGNHPQSCSNRPDVKDKSWDAYKDPETGVQFYTDFLRTAIPYLDERAPVYQWHADLRRDLVTRSWDANGLLLHQTVLWVKTSPVLTHSHFMWQHEPCAYGWRKGKQPEADRRPPANTRSVWEVANKAKERDSGHPTSKPVELCERPIEWHLRAGELCYEPFCGSGTCIIAAERLGRRCFAMEQAPEYVDVAVKRWEQFTGRTAVRDG